VPGPDGDPVEVWERPTPGSPPEICSVERHFVGGTATRESAPIDGVRLGTRSQESGRLRLVTTPVETREPFPFRFVDPAEHRARTLEARQGSTRVVFTESARDAVTDCLRGLMDNLDGVGDEVGAALFGHRYVDDVVLVTAAYSAVRESGYDYGRLDSDLIRDLQLRSRDPLIGLLHSHPHSSPLSYSRTDEQCWRSWADQDPFSEAKPFVAVIVGPSGGESYRWLNPQFAAWTLTATGSVFTASVEFEG
jgi:proteasome lid subunit RPN8/RPN11